MNSTIRRIFYSLAPVLVLAIVLLHGGESKRPDTSKPFIPPKGEEKRLAALRDAVQRLTPLHKVMPTPKTGEWLDRFEEPGQSFEEYLRCKPVTAWGKRKIIYIQPIGEFSEAQRKIINLTAEYMHLYFGLTVKLLKDIPDSVIPAEARRMKSWYGEQLLTTYILHDLLYPKRPKDAAVFLAFTAKDLWPGEGWNFVFGQASLRKRVGVWSIARKGDPSGSDAAFRLCLERTIKTATHETGHIFTIHHCTAYECNMNGSNSLEESDQHPLWCCPECMAKIFWATRVDPQIRFANLAEFCKKHNMLEACRFFIKQFEALTETEQPAKQKTKPSKESESNS